MPNRRHNLGAQVAQRPLLFHHGIMASEKATFGAGCFWGVEETFRNLKGVLSTAVGYAGGTMENPTYEDVCTDKTGHAEVVEIEFDPSQITYNQLLDVFWSSHDPTTLNRQGNDIGTQYRSVIFYHSPEQKSAAEDTIRQLDAEKVFADPVVTAIEPAKEFFPAEAYHQEYFENHPFQPYCAFVVAPKVQKFRKKFAARVKSFKA